MGFDGLGLLSCPCFVYKQAGMRALLICLGIALGAGAAPGVGSASSVSFRRFDVSDGLPHTIVDDITQGPDGRLWLATQYGIGIFDGQSFEALHRRDGLADERVHALLADGEDVWIGTDGGLHRWSGGDLQETWPIRTLAIAKRQGRLYVGNDEGLFSLGRDGFERLPEFGDFVADLLVGHDEKLWVGEERGVAVLGEHVERLSGQGVVDFELGPKGELWVAFADHVEELGSDGRLHPMALLTFETRIVIRDLHCGRDGTLWVGTDQGLVSLDDRERSWITGENGLPFTPVLSVFESKDGQLWLGGQGGLAVLASRAFEYYGLQDGFRSEVVRPILRDSAGRLWAGTTDGLAMLERGAVRNFDETDGLPRGRVTDLLSGPNGELWVGTTFGLATGDPANFEPVPNWPPSHAVLDLEWGPSGELWATTDRQLLRQTRRGFEEIRLRDQSFAAARITTGGDGARWIGGVKGLSTWKEGEWTTFTTKDGLLDDAVYTVAVAPDGAIWFCYRKGMGVSRYDDHRFRHWTTADGLASDAVYSIGFDRSGRVWLGSARGVDAFDGQHFRNYGPNEGYPSHESNAGGFFLDQDGSIWFGTNGGLAHYLPWRDTLLPPAPKLAVSLARGPEGTPMAAQVRVQSLLPRERIGLQVRLDRQPWQDVETQRLPLAGLGFGIHEIDYRARIYRGEWSPVVGLRFGLPRPLHRRPELWAFGILLVAVAGVALLQRRLRASRRRAERLEALVDARTMELRSASAHKSAFLARMSHELRSPMNGVVVAAELLQDTELDENQQDLVSTLQVSSETVLDVVNDVLDLSRIESGHAELRPEAFELGELFDQLLAMFRWRIAARGVELVFEVDQPLVVVADRGKLRQILVNLLGNAGKFTHSGRISVEARAAGGELRILVRDTGVGMTAEDARQVFAPFRQGLARSEEHSTGLGLAIVAELTKLMGGTIEVASAPGLGTQFELRFLLERGELSERSPSPPFQTRRPDGLHILLIEDDAISRKVASRLIQKMGHDCHVAGSGREALAMAQDTALDLVVTDLGLPDMDGMELAEQLRAACPTVPIIALTGAATSGDEQRCLDAGFAAFVTKPIRRDVLREALERAGYRGATARGSASGD
jgi:signal transduction histidine kinase/ligand-binding sensor domain-containing protein/ActR/RegA family two-component response regulator